MLKMLSAMFECFLANGRKIPRLEGKQTILRVQMSGRLLGIATRNWTGTACKLIERFSTLLLDAVHPPSRCSDPSSTAALNRTYSHTLFATHKTFMDLACQALDYGRDPSDVHVATVRDAHAK